MLLLLAPSKTMDVMSNVPGFVEPTEPLFIDDAAKAVAAIKKLNKSSIATYMQMSSEIAARVHAMYKNWNKVGVKPALWAYRGDVYKGIKADTLDKSQALWAQEHLIIMSGLYGIVRPFDAINPYRLEMKAALPLGKAKNIYEFWDKKLGQYVASHANGLVYNLSSDEYARPVTRYLPKEVRVIMPVFYDHRPNGTIGKAPIYNKMMRGVLARWMIDNRIKAPEELQQFSAHGYHYDVTRSSLNTPAFYREKMIPLVF